MARIIVFADYLNGRTKKENIMNNLTYIATREGVMLNQENKNDDSQNFILHESLKNKEVTVGQKEKISEMLKSNPELKETFTYDEYMGNPNMYTASVFINDGSLYLYERTLDRSQSYMKYISERPGVQLNEEMEHGLFDQYENANISNYAKELNEYKGNVYRLIVSIKREDAENLSMDSQEDWKLLLRSKMPELGKDMGIQEGSMKWIAAFHDEGYHPHVHVMVWNDNPDRHATRLNSKGINNFKSRLAHEIFAEEMVHGEKVASFTRKETEDAFKKELDKLVRPINQELKNSTHKYYKDLYKIRFMLPEKGKVYYQYLPKNVKQEVDKLVDKILKEPCLKPLLDKYIAAQKDIYSFYRKDLSNAEQEIYKNLLHPNKGQRKVMQNAIIKAAKDMQFSIVDVSGEEEKRETTLEANLNEQTEHNNHVITNMLMRCCVDLFSKTNASNSEARKVRNMVEREEMLINISKRKNKSH